jgi:hypothetical protein
LPGFSNLSTLCLKEIPMTLEEAIQAVVAARMQYQAVHQQVQHLREAWATHYAPLLQDEAVQKQAVRQAEEALRRLAIAMYQTTGGKDIASGVRVREMTRVTYEPQDALTWAMEHRLALVLDVKTFEQLARVTTLPFVTYWVEPQATLSPCFPGQPSPPTPLQNESLSTPHTNGMAPPPPES